MIGPRSARFGLAHAALLVLLTGGVQGCTSFEEALTDLQSEDQEDRLDAIVWLVEGVREGDEELLARRQEIAGALRQTLSDPSPLVRESALDALAFTARGQAVPSLLDRLRDTSPWVRRTAIRRLGDLRAKVAREPLEALLAQDEIPDVRREAASSLRKLKDERSVEPLFLALGDPDAAVRWQASQGLFAIRGKDLGPDFDAWRAELSKPTSK